MPELFSANTVAQRLSVTPLTIYRWTRAGLLRPVRLGRLLRFSDEEVARFLRGKSADNRESAAG